ncbi:replication-associated recombination protein A [soil metagenome]
MSRPRTRKNSDTLFARAADTLHAASAPLAERMRPTRFEEYVGQGHLMAEGRFLAAALAKDRVPSMILWGPPGSGKTTLARIIANYTKAHFVAFSAVLGSVQELREIVAEAEERRRYASVGDARTVLFVDEIHRFNKSQQDAFLPHVEKGLFILVGATTENPSFAVNAALLSRCKVFRLEALDEPAIASLLERALAAPRGLGGAVTADPDVLGAIAHDARGDARRALTTLDLVAEFARDGGHSAISLELLEAATAHAPLLYDKSGEEHYNVVSAFIKSMRGSDPDAAVYWLMRMLEAGDDPLFVSRRMIIFASEDVGNADARGLLVATAADEAYRRLGMPEGIYPLAHAAIYLACAPKSNAVNQAWHRAREVIRAKGALPVPKKLRNAPTKLMKEDGYGKGYQYAHDHEDGVVPGETYLPDEIADDVYYEPTDRGDEQRMGARVALLREQRKKR